MIINLFISPAMIPCASLPFYAYLPLVFLRLCATLLSAFVNPIPGLGWRGFGPSRAGGLESGGGDAIAPVTGGMRSDSDLVGWVNNQVVILGVEVAEAKVWLAVAVLCTPSRLCIYTYKDLYYSENPLRMSLSLARGDISTTLNNEI